MYKNNCKESIWFSVAEVYCVDCGHKEYYNGLKPFSVPDKCEKCGGRMTDDQKEKFLREIKNDFNRNTKRIDREMSEEDKFTIKLLETIKNEFDNNDVYSGKYIKTIINKTIKRME